MATFDFKKHQKELYSPPAEFTVVEVPPMVFLALDGAGDPNSSAEYVRSVEALYAASYAAKFHSKRELDRDYVVAPLEGLWWSDTALDFAGLDKSEWRWTMLIRQPDWVPADDIRSLLAQTAAKKKAPLIETLRLETIDEGLCVQVMHVGPYDQEAPTIARLHGEFIPQNRLRETGKHHEIYLGDPRKSAPDKLRTVLRQPVERVG